MPSCPACGRESIAGARFCPHCGAPQGARCPGCGAGVLPGARFCTECGEPVEPTEAAPEGELRQLTVVFCDLVGSTELSARLDPEEYSELLRSYQERVVEVSGRYGGVVEKYLGDGILFHFGWPEAHDDDPERAVRASLEMVDEIVALNGDVPPERHLAVRIGVHTGVVVIGEMGPAGEPEMMAIGETVNVASRLQSLAAPNTVVISGDTLDLVRGIFITEDLGAQRLKGIAEPMATHRAIQPSGIRSRIDAARDRLMPFVGREAEMALLEDRWRRARAGQGQSVLVTGEAGVGKSRLTYQLREGLREEPHSWLECRCSSYTDQSAFRPAIELIEYGLGLASSDTPGERLDKLERGLAAVGVRSADAVPLLAALLAIPLAEGISALNMSPERRRRRTIDVLTEWLLALARLQPMVLLVEDLHWCDPSSLELFGRLVAEGMPAPLMLLGTARPEFSPAALAGPSYTLLSVQPFGEGEVRRVVGALSGGRELPAAVLERIVLEAGGIPLYAEEIGRMVLESDLVVERQGRLELADPLAELDIPTTLQGSLMARLDRLSSAKRVAQLASALGREFRYDLLEEVSELGPAALRSGLERLVESELLYRRGEPPDATYSFKHALLQDAAYQSLLRRTRRALHGRVATALERHLGDDPLAEPGVVARHYEAADQPEPAVANYRRAGEQAAERSGHREAIAHLRRAIELTEQLPAGRARDEAEVEMQLALGPSVIATRTYADPEIEHAYERARELCEALGDDARIAHALTGLSIYYLNRGQMELGASLAARVLEAGERTDDETLQLLGHIHLALPAICQARFAEALEHTERARALYSPGPHRSIAFRVGTDQGVVGHCFAGQALMGLGLLDQALHRMQDGVSLARELGHPFSLAYALLFETTQHWLRGDLEGQRRTAEAVLAISEEQGFDLWIGLGHVYRAAERAVATGSPDSLPELLEGSIVAGTTGNLAFSTPVLACVADAQRAAGDLEGAAGTIEGALAVSEQTRQPWWDSDLLRLRAVLALDAAAGETNGAVARAERQLTRAVALAHEQDFRVHELRGATELARLVAARGEQARARDLLLPLYASFSEGHGTRPLRSARALLAELGADPGPGTERPSPTPDQAGSKPSSA